MTRTHQRLVLMGVAAVLLFLVQGCATTGPRITQLTPIELGPEGSAPLTFTRLIIRVPSGTQVGAHHDGLLKVPQFRHTWMSNITVGSDEFKIVASEHLKSRGYKVLGGDNILFGRAESAKAEYQLGGTVSIPDSTVFQILKSSIPHFYNTQLNDSAVKQLNIPGHISMNTDIIQLIQQQEIFVSDISLINSMIDRGILQRYNDGYAVEHNGKQGIQTEEIVPEDLNGQPGYQAEDILDYVVYNVDHMPVITEYSDFMAETDIELLDTYIEYLNIRRQGMFVFPDGQYSAGEVLRREDSFIKAFRPFQSIEVETIHGQKGNVVPYSELYFETRGAQVVACEFLNPVKIPIPPLFDSIEVDSVSYLPDGGINSVSLHDPAIIDTSAGKVEVYGFNGTPVYRAFVNQDIKLSIEPGNNFFIKKYGVIEFHSDSYSISGLSAASGVVFLPQAGQEQIQDNDYNRYNVFTNVYLHQNNTIKEFWTQEQMIIDNQGRQLLQAAGKRIGFYENGRVYYFTPAIDTEIQLANGQQALLRAGSLQFLNQEGQAYNCNLAEPISITIEGREINVSSISFSEDGKEIIRYYESR